MRTADGEGRTLAEIVAPGVWWLHGTRGSNVFLVETATGLVLVDAGFASSARAIFEEVERLRPGAGVANLLLTHAHVDHAGAAAAVRRRYGAAVVAGAGDCARDERGRFVLREPVGPSHRLRRALRGVLAGRAGPEVIVDEPLEGERRVGEVLAVPVPGHTPGSYCYVLPDRGVAFVGDLVIAHRDGLARPLQMANSDDRRYLASLRAFAERAPEVGCPGHGAPVAHGFGARVRGLAGAPRRSPWSPRGARERARRLRSFGRDLARRRAPEAWRERGE